MAQLSYQRAEPDEGGAVELEAAAAVDNSITSVSSKSFESVNKLDVLINAVKARTLPFHSIQIRTPAARRCGLDEATGDSRRKGHAVRAAGQV